MRGVRRFAVAAPVLCLLTVGPSGKVAPVDPQGASGSQALMTSFGSPVMRSARGDLDGPATPTDYGDCGPDALPETGLQGQVPRADQLSGRSKLGYRCNVRRVGQDDIGLRGQNFQLAWYEDCAYVSTVGIQAYTGAAGTPAPELDGIGVVDARDPLRPQLAGVVKSPVAKSSHEALEVNQARGLLVTTQGGLIARYVEVYDVREDCRRPRFLGRYDAGIPIFHGLRVSDDGMTVYATDTFALSGFSQIMHVVDIRDPRRPRRLLTWDPLRAQPRDSFGIHDLDVNEDGTRIYAGTAPYQSIVGVVAGGPPSVGPGTSLAILDASDVQARRPGADLKVVSRLSLPNIGHTVQRMRVGGRPYLLVSGEEPIGGPQNCPWAWGHIVDISDERTPRRVSDLKLEVNDIRNCSKTSQDAGAIYSIHYVGVDDERDTRLVFYTYYTGGMRVFDVRDPEQPKEVAYYQPPATPETKFPPLAPITPDSNPGTYDHTPSMVRYRPETGALWIASANAGFQVLQLTGSAAPQRDTVRVLPRRRSTTARTGMLPVRLSCEQPCRATVRLTVAGRRVTGEEVALGARGATTVRVRIPAAARRALRKGPRARVSATADVRDRLTGEARAPAAASARTLRG